MGPAQHMANRLQRAFQLADHHLRLLQQVFVARQHGRRQVAVAAGDDDDGVLAAVVDHDQRHPAGLPGHPLDALAVDALGLQRAVQLVAVGIVAKAADHRHLRAETRRGDRLVGSLAAGNGDEGLPGEGLAAPWQARRAHYQVHVQAAHHQYFRLHRCVLVPASL